MITTNNDNEIIPKEKLDEYNKLMKEVDDLNIIDVSFYGSEYDDNLESIKVAIEVAKETQGLVDGIIKERKGIR